MVKLGSQMQSANVYVAKSALSHNRTGSVLYATRCCGYGDGGAIVKHEPYRTSFAAAPAQRKEEEEREIPRRRIGHIGWVGGRLIIQDRGSAVQRDFSEDSKLYADKRKSFSHASSLHALLAVAENGRGDVRRSGSRIPGQQQPRGYCHHLAYFACNR